MCPYTRRETSAGQPRGMNSSPHLVDNQLSEDSVTREGKNQQLSKRCRPRLRLCVQRHMEKANQSPGAGSSNRPEVPRDAESAAAQQCSMSESKETQQRSVQEAVGTTQEGLSQRRRSYGSKLRREVRNESTVQDDDKDAGRKRQPRRENRDESTVGVVDESLEMS